MKEKRVFYSELAYFVGIIVLALGTALMERANFGVSMVVAPAYLIHLKVSEMLPFFSFGMSEYVFQAALLIGTALVMRRVKLSYFLSFVTAFLYGLVLDVMIGWIAWIPYTGMLWRIAFFAVGLIACTIGIALLFDTYFPPEAYELLVKEISLKFHLPLGKVKTIYDFCSCALSILLSLSFFGAFVGVHWGTVICTALNGILISFFGRVIHAIFVFRDAFPLREKLK